MSYASQYNVCPELVSAGIVLCTAVSAPLMFLSAQILNILSSPLQQQHLSLTIISLHYNVGMTSVIGVSLTLTIFLASKRYRQVPHCFTTTMLIESLLAPSAAVLRYYEVISSEWRVRTL